MKFRTVDSNGDWVFGRGVNSYSRRNSAIGLNIRTRLLSWKNDCFFDLTAGVDWYNRLGSKNQRDLLEQEIRRIILQSEGVTGINQFDTILNNRNFSLYVDVSTQYSSEYQQQIELSV